MENLVDSIKHFSKIFSTVQPSEGLQKGKRLLSSSVTLLYSVWSASIALREGGRYRKMGRGEKNSIFRFNSTIFNATFTLKWKNFWFNIYDTLFIGYLFFCLLSQEWKSHDGRTLLISRTVSSTQWAPNKYMLKEEGKCHIRTISFLPMGNPTKPPATYQDFPTISQGHPGQWGFILVCW